MKQGIFARAIAADSTEQVVDIVGVIGWQVEYQTLRNILRGIPDNVKSVLFDIYSPGGDVWEGNGIVQEIGELSKRGVKTKARIQVAASMATLIAVACDERTMAGNGRWLIHNAWTQTVGDAAEHEKQAKTLREAEAEAAKFYASRTGGKPEDMLKLMAEERWLMPDEAKQLGFVQMVCDPFEPEEYESVKKEIVAAGKWPKALVDMPKAEEVKPKEEAKVHDAQATAGTSPVQTVEQKAPAVAADAKPETPAEDGRYSDGVAAGRAGVMAELKDQIDELNRKLAEAEKLASKYQSEKDRLAAQLAQCQKVADERAEKLRKELENATAKLRQFVDGALTFSPTVETWEEAMRDCNGDYAKAAAKYPTLLDKYRAEQRQKERTK